MWILKYSQGSASVTMPDFGSISVIIDWFRPKVSSAKLSPPSPTLTIVRMLKLATIIMEPLFLPSFLLFSFFFPFFPYDAINTGNGKLASSDVE